MPLTLLACHCHIYHFWFLAYFDANFSFYLRDFARHGCHWPHKFYVLWNFNGLMRVDIHDCLSKPLSASMLLRMGAIIDTLWFSMAIRCFGWISVSLFLHAPVLPAASSLGRTWSTSRHAAIDDYFAYYASFRIFAFSTLYLILLSIWDSFIKALYIFWLLPRYSSNYALCCIFRSYSPAFSNTNLCLAVLPRVVLSLGVRAIQAFSFLYQLHFRCQVTFYRHVYRRLASTAEIYIYFAIRAPPTRSVRLLFSLRLSLGLLSRRFRHHVFIPYFSVDDFHYFIDFFYQLYALTTFTTQLSTMLATMAL